MTAPFTDHNLAEECLRAMRAQAGIEGASSTDPNVGDRMLNADLMELIRKSPQAFQQFEPGYHGPVSEHFRHEALKHLGDTIRALECMSAILRVYPNFDRAYDVFGADVGHALNRGIASAYSFRNARECVGAA